MATQPAQTAQRERGGNGSNPPPVRRRMALPAQQRLVVLLAEFNSLKRIRAVMLEEFGLEIGWAALSKYDPSRSYCNISKALRALWREARERHLTDLSDIGIAHQGHRLRALSRMAQVAEDKGDLSQAASLIKQAAEEVGGLLTNTRKVDVRHLHLSLDDAKQELAMRLSAMVEEQELLPPPDKG